jgi:hypothetical protein
MDESRSPEFKPKVTPEQVKEKLPNDKQPTKKASQPTEKPKKETKKAEKKDAALTFPETVRINAYGFIGLKKGLLEALGWRKGMGLKIDKNADGSVTVRKA